MTSIRNALIDLEQRRSPEMSAAVEQLQSTGVLSRNPLVAVSQLEQAAACTRRGQVRTEPAVPESPEKATPDAYPNEASSASNTLVLRIGDPALFAAGFALGLAASLIVCGICVGVAS